MIEVNAAIELTKMNLIGSKPEEKYDHIIACHEAMRNMVEAFKRELEAITAQRDGIAQTCGELCPWCGWRGLRGDAGECAFCQNAQLSADLHNLRNAKELAERQVAVLLSVTGVTCPPGITQCMRGVCGVHKTVKDCQECIEEWSHSEAVKEGSKG